MSTILPVEHIVSDPNQHGGKPYIAGRGITVHYIAQLFNLDWTAEDLIEQFELTPGQAYAAVSYYLNHKSEIDQEMNDLRAKLRLYLKS